MHLLFEQIILIIASVFLWAACAAAETCKYDEAAFLQAKAGRTHHAVRDPTNFELLGGIPSLPTLTASWRNGKLLNSTLNALQPGDMFVIPNRTFHTMGGIVVSNLSDVVIQIDGSLEFWGSWYAPEVWPRYSYDGYLQYDKPLAAMYFYNCTNVTFTSSGQGKLDGGGPQWWGVPGVGYLVHGEDRPTLMHIELSTDLLIENLFLKNSPKYHFDLDKVVNAEVRNTRVEADRKGPSQGHNHNVYQLTAFNTDGFDVSGSNIWIHDSYIWVQDDCIAVKEDTGYTSRDMVFERLTASGLGLTIGAQSGRKVAGPNITFRDIYMPNTVNGIYIKILENDKILTTVTGITYENILIENASHWPIWIGPAQQADSDQCVLQWPFTKRSWSHCLMPVSNISNIILRNISVKNPKLSPGVIWGNSSTPIVNITFDDVSVTNPGMIPWNTSYYYCEGVASGTATGSTWPVPPCFQQTGQSTTTYHN